MKPAELLEILTVAEKLKCNTRHCYTSTGRHESVAEHCWRTALIAMLISDEIPEADMDKVIRMILIHDLGEAFTGDIPSFDKTKADEAKEEDVLNEWVRSFPEPARSQWIDLYEEMNALETVEARVYKALDKMEAIIQHDNGSLDTWIPEEYKYQFEYGWENVRFNEYLTALRSEIDKMTRDKITREGASIE